MHQCVCVCMQELTSDTWNRRYPAQWIKGWTTSSLLIAEIKSAVCPWLKWLLHGRSELRVVYVFHIKECIQVGNINSSISVVCRPWGSCNLQKQHDGTDSQLTNRKYSRLKPTGFTKCMSNQWALSFHLKFFFFKLLVSFLWGIPIHFGSNSAYLVQQLHTVVTPLCSHSTLQPLF